jgi:hypothetical protein
MNTEIFVRLDADNIGDAIELSLINSDISRAKSIHQKVQSGIKSIEKQLIENDYCTVLMKGCDDILFKIKIEHFSESLLIELKEEFLNHSGYSLSIGIAYSLEGALINLRKAKLSGKNIIVSNIK